MALATATRPEPAARSSAAPQVRGRARGPFTRCPAAKGSLNDGAGKRCSPCGRGLGSGRFPAAAASQRSLARPPCTRARARAAS